jgi:hypothetical protein
MPAVTSSPTSDVSAGGWTATPLWQKIDEAAVDTSDYVSSSASLSTDTFEVQLASLSNIDVTLPQVVQYYIGKSGEGVVDFFVQLLDGTSIVAEWTIPNVGLGWAGRESYLTPTERGAIADHTDLRLRFTVIKPILRDLFLSDDAGPISAVRTVEPTGGLVSFTNTADWYIQNRWLRSMGQVTPTWGNMKALWPAVTRTTGYALAAHVAVGDRNQDFAFGFATGTGVADPRTNGLAWIMQEGFLEISEPSRNVRLGGAGTGGFEVRPTEHLPVIALNQKGAVYLLSSYDDGDGSPALGRLYPRPFAKYPKATVLWRNDSDTTATLYPLISSYDRLGMHTSYKDLRVVKVDAWSAADFIATHVERFDSNITLGAGNGWTVPEGTWTSSSGTLGMTGGTFRRRAYKNFGLVGNGFWRAKVTMDSTDTTKEVGFVFRVVDNNNFVFFTIGNGNVSIHYFNNGNYMWALYNNPSPVTLVAGATYDCCVCTDGDYWRVWVNGAEPGPGWVTIADVYENGTGFGPYAGAATDARWDDFVCDPLEVDLPLEIRAGSVPKEWHVGDVVFEDNFVDTNGVSLVAHTPDVGGVNWTEPSSTWTIQSNRATGGSFALVDTGTADHEIEGTIILPSSATTVRAGWIMRWQDVNNNVYFRLFKDAGQPGTDEIEVLGNTNGVALDIMKVQFPPYFTSNQSVHVRAQIKGNVLRLWLDGQPVLTHITEVMTGMCGMYREVGVDTGAIFENFIVREIHDDTEKPLYVFRDTFPTDDAAPIADPRTAVPGPATIDFTGPSFWSIRDGYLIGGGQGGSGVWGNSKAVLPSVIRQAGRTMTAHTYIIDRAGPFTFGYASGAGVTDPRTDGQSHVFENGAHRVSVPSKTVNLTSAGDPFDVRTMEYQTTVALNTRGALYLLSAFDEGDNTPALGRVIPRPIAKFPKATIMWRDDAAASTTTPLYPTISALEYPHRFRDLRVMDVGEWMVPDFGAIFVDRFDTNGSLDARYTTSGTWTKASGKVGVSGGSGVATFNAGTPDGWFRCKMTIAAGGITNSGFRYKHVDNNNFGVIEVGGAGSIRFHKVVAGSYAGMDFTYPYTFNTGQTYEFAVQSIGNNAHLYIDGNDLGQFTIDAAIAAGTIFGISSDVTTTATWDDLIFDPLEIDLPTEFLDGSAPTEWEVGDVLLEDGFVDTNGTSLDAHTPDVVGAAGWVEQSSNWEIQSNRAVRSGTGDAHALYDTGTDDHEVEGTIYTSDTSVFHAGYIMRWESTADHLMFRLFRHVAGQPGTDEIEVIEAIAGSGLIRLKVQFPGPYFVNNTPYHVRAQVKGDVLRIWLDGQPVISYVCNTMTGVVGIYRGTDDTGATFDNIIVREIL